MQSKSGGNFLVVPLHFFGSKSTVSSRFGKRFRDGQYSLVIVLFAVILLTVPRAQPFVKVVGARAPVPYGVGATVVMLSEMDVG